MILASLLRQIFTMWACPKGRNTLTPPKKPPQNNPRKADQ
jgi:hypothetical protein